jgi:hypothetical protein
VSLSCAAMPPYRFAVHNGHRHDDQERTELPSDEAAREEVLQVIRSPRDKAAWLHVAESWLKLAQELEPRPTKRK